MFVPIGGQAPANADALDRRGVPHGYVVPEPLEETTDAAAAWRRGAPIVLPGLLADGIDEYANEIGNTLRCFAHLRDGGSWLDACDLLLGDEAGFAYSGSTVDHGDAREIERLFVDAVDDSGAKVARDLTARASWIADDESDLSMRIRFSFGHESLREWLDVADPRAAWSDRFAAAVFPECAVLDNEENRGRLAEWRGAEVRLSERIVYSNAPGGGAVFHHDADPHQRGVLFGQLEGRTAWLALPQSELDAAITAHTDAFGEAPLDHPIGEDLWRLLNMTPAFTQRLAESGALRVLGPGDAIVLPTPDPDHIAWHSVFALGAEPSLAHSYGIFDA